MIKLLICKSATMLFGVLAVGILAKRHTVALHLNHVDLLGAALGLLSAISGTQWIEYQRRYDSAQSDKPGWLQQLFYTGLLVGCASQSGAQCFDNRLLYIDDALKYTVSSMVLGDFNGDGKTDIAAAHYNANAVSVVMGDGAYSFAGIKGTSFNLLDKKSSYAVGYNPRALATGFFNNDFKIDLVVANNGNHTISVLLNKGNGDFYPAVTYPVGDSPTAIAVSDFNKDGNADVIVTNISVGGGIVSILAGKGDGSFKLVTQFKTGGIDPEAIVIGDFNGDGNPDLATSDFIDGTVSVRYGNGLGGVGGVFNYAVGKQPRSMAIRDLNDDGRPDVVVSLNGENKVAVLYTGIGIGGLFYPPVKYDVGYLPTAVCLGDIDNDGKIDILVANYNSGDISVLLNQGNYFLAGDSMFNGSFSSKPAVMVMGYINSDKYLDLAIGYGNTNVVDLRFQSCLPVRQPIYYPSARQSTDRQKPDGQSSELNLQATISPNPVEGQLHVHIDGVGDEPVRLVLTDLQGHTVADQTIQLTDDQHQATLPMGQSEPGMYLLRVSTATESKTLKVLKR